MIPLTLRVAVENSGEDAFVVKVRGNDDDASEAAIDGRLLEKHSAELAAVLPDELIFATAHGYLRVSEIPLSEIEGDVLFVDPRRGTAHRWIRARSLHNTLVVTERCDQLCVMCSQPPKKHHADLFNYLKTAALLAPQGVEIGISGGEPTLYKRELFDLLSTVLAARPDLRFHVLTNAQHFTEGDLTVLHDPVFRSVCWGVPLYAANADAHDTIVGKEGAFESLSASFALLLRAAASVELRTVVMRPNLELLPDLAWYVSTHLSFVHTWALMQLENIGFARMRWNELFADHSIDFAPIASAMDIALSRGINVQLYNCPLCTVPPQYRVMAGCTISDWKRRYVAACAPCSERTNCSGFFEWYPEERGFQGVHPL